MRGFVIVVFALIVGLIGPARTLSADDGGIVIEKPWARASILKSRPGVAYLTIRNEGPSADRLVEATSPLAGSVALHASEMSGGTMTMHAMQHLEIAQGDRVVLEPGGMHLMLIDLRQSLREGEDLPMVLEFEHAGTLKVTVPVLSPAAKGPDD